MAEMIAAGAFDGTVERNPKLVLGDNDQVDIELPKIDMDFKKRVRDWQDADWSGALREIEATTTTINDLKYETLAPWFEGSYLDTDDFWTGVYHSPSRRFDFQYELEKKRPYYHEVENGTTVQAS